MKYKTIFKKWHFWLFSLGYAGFLFIIDVTSPIFYTTHSLDILNPDYSIFLFYFLLRISIVVGIYSLIWILYWKKQKE